jgi:hypothetical protein
MRVARSEKVRYADASASGYLHRAIGGGCQVEFNDAPGRTFAEVLAAFEAAAVLAEGEGMQMDVNSMTRAELDAEYRSIYAQAEAGAEWTTERITRWSSLGNELDRRAALDAVVEKGEGKL